MASVLLPIAYIVLQISLPTHAWREDNTASACEPDDSVSLMQMLRAPSGSRRSEYLKSVVSREFPGQCETALPQLSSKSDGEILELCKAFSFSSCDSAFELLGDRPWSGQAIQDACDELRDGSGGMHTAPSNRVSTSAALLERRSLKAHLHMTADVNHASGLEATLQRKGFDPQRTVAQPPYYLDLFDCEEMMLWVPDPMPGIMPGQNVTNVTNGTVTHPANGTVHYILNYTNVTLYLNASYAERVDKILDNTSLDHLPAVPYWAQKDLNLTDQERTMIIRDNVIVSTLHKPYPGIKQLGYNLYVTNCTWKSNWSIPIAPQLLNASNASMKNRDYEDTSQFLANSSSMNVTIPTTTTTTTTTVTGSTVETVEVFWCGEEQQLEQCFGLKQYKKENITWQMCQAACCRDMSCEVWQFNSAPLACWMGVPDRCGGGSAFELWDHGGRKQFLQASEIAKVNFTALNSTSNLTLSSSPML